MLRLYDTATREVRELAQREPGKVSIYLCGPTVYAPPHLGHGRQNVVYDVLVRYLRWSGVDVRLVSNITDIDDQIINRANAEGRPWQDITTKCEAVWFDAQARLGVARPDDTPRATEYVDEMVAMIGQLVEIGRAYTTDDGVYLSVETVEDYGLLAHQSLDDMLAGGGDRDVVGADLKRHPADFVLWKLAKPGEPSWPSPWGEGRPGWHSECVVMSLDLLGEGFDLHCGGMDLRFPHHENERAQAVALGKRFANHWMHHAFVVDAEGEKMSKSLGNVDNLLDLLDRYDERTYRMLLLQSHYRSPVRVGIDSLQGAERALAGLDSFASRSAAADGDTRRRRAGRVLGGDGRRPRHAGGDGRPLRRRPPRQRRARCRCPRGRPARRRGAGDRRGGRADDRPDRRGARPTSSPGPPRSTPPGRPRTTAPPTPSGPSCRASGWIVETTAAGTSVRR